MFQLLLLLGFYTLGISSIHQYHFINENKTWAEAQKYCRENYADLATVHDDKEQLDLTNKVWDSQRIWIGLYDDLNSWKWSLNDDDLYKEGEKSFNNWYINKPRNSGGKDLCVYYNVNYASWWESDCSNMRHFLCYDGKVNVSQKYVQVYEYKNWTEAQRYCREHHTDMASIRNETENQNIRSVLVSYYTYSAVWIGLYRTRSWSDKSNSSFSNWKPGQPDNAGDTEYCTAVNISLNGTWRDENCNQEISFFCYSTISSTSYQYHFINKNMTWTEAQLYCRENYTDLATINNVEDMNMLIDTVNGSYSGLAWIGLYDDLESWRWSLDDAAFYKEGEREFRGWEHQPDNYDGNQLCVLMRADGTWFDDDCNNNSPFVCYNGRNPTKYYIWINQYMTWTGAQNYCRQQHTDLASIKTQEDNKQILNLIRGSGSWIGLYRKRLWSDQDNSLYENWKPLTPSFSKQPDNGMYNAIDHGNQLCTAVSLRNSGQWRDENCIARLPFVCYNKLSTGYSCTNHQYYFVNENKTWSEAQKHCRDVYTDLATINNIEDTKRLLKAVKESYYGLAWIGLYDDLNSWKWSLNDGVFYKEEEKSFSNWYIEKPKNQYGNSLCVYVSVYDGIWRDNYCSNNMQFFCYDGKENSSESFILVNKYLNWTEAQRYCRDHYTDLASVRNEKENQKLRAILYQSQYSGHIDFYNYFYYGYINNNYNYNYNYYSYYYGGKWIGLYRTWSWSDKSNYSFSNWKSGEPYNGGSSDYCTAVSFTKSGQWSSEYCGQALPFLCYSNPSTSYREYHFVNESKNWTEAQRYCRENYTDLATIENMEEMNRTFNTVNGSYSDLAWIGLYDDLESWRWSLDDDGFYKKGEKDFRGWNHQPDNYGGKQMCVKAQKNGWFDEDCSTNLQFVCYDAKDNSYVWIYTSMTWKEAQSYCRTQYTDLASVRNETELQKILDTSGDNPIWIGLYRNRLWSDQSNSTFTYWSPEIPSESREPDNGRNVAWQYGNQHCTAVDDSGWWRDENCLATFPFVCYILFFTGPSSGLRMNIKTGKNLKDSQIQELVSNQLKQELIRLGVSSNFTISVRNTCKADP
ncbi:macrophage mannose receptor 1-like [Trichomycterus rosablanca]|uniref:macrophage mannose receptor 1-like n=1 Tax=Trichomycterus rosablanca TaxID=2290929 RepID=UPI002F353099